MKRSVSFGGLFISIVTVLLTKQGSGSGIFEVQPLVFLNPAGVDERGDCCAGSKGTDAISGSGSGRCSGAPCRTYFRVCLSHYQSALPADVACTFGKITTTILGANSIYFASNDTLNIPFEFTWPGSFTLIVEAWHNSSALTAYPSHESRDRLIFRTVTLGMTDGSSGGWLRYGNLSTDRHSFDFRVRVVCRETYFGPGCSDTCQPRDDKFGHYRCSSTGAKICRDGWTGQYCDKAVCLDGCNPIQGFCEDPYECKCRLGWQGERCHQCVPYPGCQHGSCKAPWQCNCDDGWGGLFCTQDLNFCTNYQPCHNGGICTNAGQGSYSCSCPPGFTGSNCEKETENCDHVPCQNGGKCQLNRDSQLRCSCPPHYHGTFCQWNEQRSCDLQPCLNNGTCSEQSGQYHCLCPSLFTGFNCETTLDACASNPCFNGGRCVVISGGSDFACRCETGNSGHLCEDDRNHCAGSPCLNGATCLPDRKDGFRCRCPPGYAGILCQDDVDDCLDNPCVNGAACVDAVADFRCACAIGFSGRRCDVTSSSCLTSPCRNRGTCVRRSDQGFECLCAVGFRGEVCELVDGRTAPAFDAVPDKQLLEDEEEALGVGIGQVVLIVVLGAGLPVLVLLAGVVLLVVKRRGDVTGDDLGNVRTDDVINWNRTKSDLETGRTLKITNEERQQRMQCDRKEEGHVQAAGQRHCLDRDRPRDDHVTDPSKHRTDPEPPTERPLAAEGHVTGQKSRDAPVNTRQNQQQHPRGEFVYATDV